MILYYLQEASVMKKYIIVLIAMAILLLCLCIYGWIKQESDKKQATTLQKDRIDAGNTIFSYYGKTLIGGTDGMSQLRVLQNPLMKMSYTV